MNKTIAVLFVFVSLFAFGQTTQVNHGGTGLNSTANNKILIGTGANTYILVTVPDCQDTSGNHWNYNATTHTVSCGTSSSPAAININGSSVSSPNFNDTTPAAVSNNVNVTWQASGSSVSAQVAAATGSTLGVVKSLTCSNQFFRSLTTGTGTFNCATVDLANDVAGNLGVSHLNSGTSASSSTFWRGDGSWTAVAFTALSGSLACSQMPAGTGDVTWPAGSCTTTLGNIPTATTMAGYVLATNIAAPSTPASGKTAIYVDSTKKMLAAKNDAGQIGYTVIDNAGSLHNFVTSIVGGAVATAQVADSDLSISNITTNNSSTSAHGFLKQLDNNAAHYMDGTGAWSTPAGGGGGGGGSFPLTIVQEGAFQSGSSNTASFTVTFPQALASSGNTAFMLVAADGSSTVTAPAGWTIDINQSQASFARFILAHKTSASDTSATWTVGSASSFAIYFFEVSGAHALDQSSHAGVANEDIISFPSITPSSGATIFAMAGIVGGSAGPTTLNFVKNPLSSLWQSTGFCAVGVSGGRCLVGHIYAFASSGTAVTPPSVSLGGNTLFAGGGIAYASFSIL